MLEFAYANSESSDRKTKRLALIQILNLIDSEEGILKAHNEFLEHHLK